MEREKLRYGIMYNGKTVPKYKVTVIQELADMDNVELSLLIVNSKNVNQKDTSSILDKIKNINPSTFLYQVYSKFFYNPSATENVDISQMVEGTPTISCEVREEGEFSQYFTEDNIEKIDSYNLDFILRFGFGIIRGDILEVPKYGVWSFHHDDPQKYRGRPACFWEIYKGDDITGAILQRLTDRLDGGIILKKGFFKTVKHSHSRNRNKASLESAKWPAQVCTDILNGNADYLHDAPTETDAPVYQSPNNFQFISFLLKMARDKNLLNRYYGAFFVDKWNIGIVDKPIRSFLNSEETKDVEWLPESKDRNKFKADPFGIAKEDDLTIAFEDYNRKVGRGVISGIQVEDGLNPNGLNSFEPEIFLNEPFHLSYPYLFEYDGEVFCVPESKEANEIALYKAKEFPKRWVKAKTLVDDVKGRDATLFQHKGKWWLTCKQKKNLNLFIYWANELTGSWKPHLNNPVKTDIRSSRPAGTPFVYESDLYRPAQDCSKTYGGRVAINKVETLTKGKFEEKTVKYITPYSSYPSGIHTISAVGDRTLIDGKRDVLNLGHFLRLVRKKLGIG